MSPLNPPSPLSNPLFPIIRARKLLRVSFVKKKKSPLQTDLYMFSYDVLGTMCLLWGTALRDSIPTCRIFKLPWIIQRFAPCVTDWQSNLVAYDIVTYSWTQGPLTKVSLSPYAEWGLVLTVKSKMGQKGLLKEHEGFASLHFISTSDFTLRILLSRTGLSVFQNKYFCERGKKSISRMFFSPQNVAESTSLRGFKMKEFTHTVSTQN